MAASAYPVRSPSHEANPTIAAASHFQQQQPAHPTPQSPRGPCSFRELSLGHTCGCRRFSINLTIGPQGNAGAPSTELAGGHTWCFCGHHACFHAWEERVDAAVGIQEVDTRVKYLDTVLPTTGSPLQLRQKSPSLVIRPPGSVAAGVGFSQTHGISLHHPHPQPEHPRFSRLRRSPDGLPSTQSSVKLQPETTSYNARQPSASPSRRFVTQVASARNNLALGFPTTTSFIIPDEVARSPTELATPSNSMISSPNLHEADAAFQDVTDGLERLNSRLAPRSSTSPTRQASQRGGDVNSDAGATASDLPAVSERLLTQMTSLKTILLSVPNFSTSLSGLARRIDALENTSFGHGSVEELQERYEHFDGRLLDVEGRVEELERIGNVTSPRLLGPVTTQWAEQSDEEIGSVAQSMSQGKGSSVCSFRESTHHSRNFRDEDASTRLEQLERRLSRFEASASPSPTNPWTIEVVLLPWGRNLKGVWCTASDFSQLSGPLPTEFNSLTEEEHWESSSWRGRSSDDWQFARACGPTKGTFGRVYERLKSRGFVRTITITGGSAREVEFELMWALEGPIRALKDDKRSVTNQKDASAELLGLCNPFIPLRKVHKSSRLRFLTTGELATPSLWTAEFLNASVLMKAPMVGNRRLFITHPAAYFQRPDSSNEWTWQRLRAMPRVKQSHQGNRSTLSPVGDADVMEACWDDDSRLDVPVSAQSSFAAASSSGSGSAFGSSFASPPPSPQQHAQQLPRRWREVYGDHTSAKHSALESSQRPLPTPLSQHPSSARESQALRRTSSVPIASTEDPVLMPSTTKRHIASFDDANVQVMQGTPSAKRRRLSKTPSGDCIRASAWGFTPRLSREPPSPSTNQQPFRQHGPTSHKRSVESIEAKEGDGHASQMHAGQGRIRAVTPSAYATPFSYNVGGDTDVDVDSDSDSDGSIYNEDGETRESTEWQGGGREADTVGKTDDIISSSAADHNDEEVWEGVGEEEDGFE